MQYLEHIICNLKLPLFGFRSVPRSASVKLKNSTVERTFKDPEVRFTYPMKPKELLSILGKIKHNVPNRIPYVCNRDLDLFLKRLRSQRLGIGAKEGVRGLEECFAALAASAVFR